LKRNMFLQERKEERVVSCPEWKSWMRRNRKALTSRQYLIEVRQLNM
jgi:hypothetical protein